MTLKEMNKAIEIHKQLDEAYEAVEALRAAAGPKAKVITGMPSGSSVYDKVGEFAVEIADMTTEIGRMEDELKRAQDRNAVFVATIPNVKTRTVFNLRFVHCLMWKEVAAAMGPYCTADGVYKICRKYLRNQ
jgi:seryl-tRNA synthetase